MNESYLDRLAERLRREGLDAMMICPGETMEFFLSYTPMYCERFQGLFVKADGSLFYLCNLLYEDELRAALPPSVEVLTWFDGDAMAEVVAGHLRQRLPEGARLAVSDGTHAGSLLDVAEKLPLRLSNGELLLQRLRMIKTPEELQALRVAAQIADAALLETLPRVRPGMTEGQVKELLMEAMQRRGGEEPDGLVASGPNCAYAHYIGSQRRLEERDVLLMDFGCRYRGLRSDTTRTVFLGEPTPEQREVYDLVLRANEAAEAMAVAGAEAPAIDRRAREILDEKGYAWTLNSRLGHGIGYAVHEQPDIKASNPIRLEAGMAFSIEPGIYLKDRYGVRIEDIVIINERGEREVLNKTPKALTVL